MSLLSRLSLTVKRSSLFTVLIPSSQWALCHSFGAIHCQNVYGWNKRYHTTDSSASGIRTGFETETLYHTEADKVMDIVTELCDDLFEFTNDDFDYKTASGVLNIDFGRDVGTWVLNKQAPNQQLWLSSPISGPNHYDWDKDNQQWVSSRDGHSLCCLLQNEFTQTVKSDITFEEPF
eukprot:599505_1